MLHFFHKNVIFVAAGAGKSDATKCQGFFCCEGNLVLSDGRFTIQLTCRACDFNGWVWPLLAPDDTNIPIYRLEYECRMIHHWIVSAMSMYEPLAEIRRHF